MNHDYASGERERDSDLSRVLISLFFPLERSRERERSLFLSFTAAVTACDVSPPSQQDSRAWLARRLSIRILVVVVVIFSFTHCLGIITCTGFSFLSP